MQGAPLYYPSRAVQRQGTSDVLETVFSTDTPPDSLAEWYRQAILDRGWDLIGDTPSPDGGVVLHVQRDGPPLWVMIRPGEGGQGSTFSLIGAVPPEPDSSASRR
jgi:hypothetical protein